MHLLRHTHDDGGNIIGLGEEGEEGDRVCMEVKRLWKGKLKKSVNTLQDIYLTSTITFPSSSFLLCFSIHGQDPRKKRETETDTASVCHFTLMGTDMASQIQIALGREIGAVFRRLLLNIATLPYSYLTALKIDPPLAPAVLSLEWDIMKSKTTKYWQYLNTAVLS